MQSIRMIYQLSNSDEWEVIFLSTRSVSCVSFFLSLTSKHLSTFDEILGPHLRKTSTPDARTRKGRDRAEKNPKLANTFRLGARPLGEMW
jgi:hypothetical protein